MRNKRCTVGFPTPLIDTIRMLAKEKHMTIVGFISHLVSLYLQANKK